jgi:uncharacterized membrane protein (UPF0182 family)
MRSRKTCSARALVGSLIVLGLLPVNVFAQEIVSPEMLDEWFYSRVMLGALVGALLGILVGLTHLCRLRFQVTSLSVNSQARRKFLGWLIGLFIVGSVALFLDAWLLYPFSMVSLAFGETLTQVWLNYRMLLILVVTLVTFTLLVFVSTRLKSDCRCRYAFLPGPRGK